jgi:glycosyltransferase involved in cell wall biosynthesis
MINREQLKHHFAEATALVLPSLEDNCPMVVLEAMAAGVPVAAARVGGVPELIDDGRTGLFLEPLQPESIAGAVQRLVTEPALAERLTMEAKREAQRRFHPREIAARHVGIYREVIGVITKNNGV